MWNHPGNTNPPIGSQTVYPDYVSGVLCAIIIISGVLYRDRQKQGAFIDLAQSEATAFMIGANLMEAASSGINPEPIGNASVSTAPHGCYPCKGDDRWCVVSAENEQQWEALEKILGTGVVGNARFKTNADRLQNRQALDEIIAKWTKGKDAFAVRDQLQKVGVPAGVVQTGKDLVNDPQLIERDFIVGVDNARLGHVVLPNFPLHFTNAKLTRRWEFPVLGRDTETVLREVVGYDEATIAAHRRDGVLE
jgi:benzylsuccinate CoA-transferase BbsF subunit